MLRFFLFLCALIASLQAKILNPTTITLNNGLQVILIQNKMAPVVSIGVLYHVGTADDPATEVGLSHFLEHMMFKGTKKFKANTYAENIKKLGGSHNAYTSYDLTHYISDVPIEGLSLVLDMEADRMINLNFDNERDLIPEQKVVHQERLMRMENSPFSEALEAYLKACYWYSPYGIPPIGYPHHIDAYTHKSVIEHYKKWYTPNNASLIIVGNINEQETITLVKKYFDPIKPRIKPMRKRPQEPDHNGVTIYISQENKRSANTILYYSYRIPAFHKMLDGEFEALIIFEHIFGSNSTNPLYKDLIIEKKLALDLGVSGVDYTIDDTYINLSAALSPDQSLRTLQQKLTPTLKEFIEKTLSEEDIAQAKKEITNAQIFIKDSRTSIRSLFDALAYGVSVEHIVASDERLKTVSLQHVKDVYKKYLDKKPDVILHLYNPQNKKLKKNQNREKKQEISIFHKLKSFFTQKS
jgi:zinc protease